MKQVRLMLWLLVALAAVGTAALLIVPRALTPVDHSATTAQSTFGGPFTLIGADGKPFSSDKLLGKPYVIYFGFTRCGDVCPTTLSRMISLRKEIGGNDSYNIVFVTIDPKNDGPKEVGQYADLFNSPIIGLTGSQSQINRVKKQYGILRGAFAAPDAGQGDDAQRNRPPVRPEGAIRHDSRTRRF